MSDVEDETDFAVENEVDERMEASAKETFDNFTRALESETQQNAVNKFGTSDEMVDEFRQRLNEEGEYEMDRDKKG